MQLTHQELFDNAWNHFVVNKAPPAYQIIPSRSHPICCYRGLNNTKCAIGVSIPDDKYTPNIEGLSAIRALNKVGIIPPYIKGSDRMIDALYVNRLQFCHDYANVTLPDFHEKFKAFMIILAKDYSLQTPN